MPTMDELNWGDEIVGVVCPEGGCSLVWYGDGVHEHMQAYCDEHGFVSPVRDPAVLLEDFAGDMDG